MAGRPSKRMHVHGEVVEINLIPLMNVFCIIIPFLILFAVFVQLSIVETNLPTSTSDEVAPEEEKKDDKPKLTLTVALTVDGFKIAGAGGVLDVGDTVEQPAEGEEPHKPQTLIPKIEKDGQLVYDFEKLQEKLIKVKEKFPTHFTVILLPEDQVSYQEIVTTMDFAREYPDPNDSTKSIPLFYNPVLAGGLR